MKTTLFLVTLLAGAAAEEPVEHEALDLEVVVEGGRRELFPLLPGTKCPTGHRCRARVGHMGHNRESVVPMMANLHDNMKNPLAVAEEQALNQAVNTILEDGNDYCARRSALSRALGLAAGLAFSTVSNPAFAAGGATVKMGDDSGQLVFVPKNTKICKGDSVTWYVEEPRETGTPRATPRALPLSPHCRGLSTAGSSTRPAPTTSSSTRRPSRRA